MAAHIETLRDYDAEIKPIFESVLHNVVGGKNAVFMLANLVKLSSKKQCVSLWLFHFERS